MTRKLEVDPTLLRKAAQKTKSVGDRLNTTLQTLENALAGRGTPWGEDRIGNQFFVGDGKSGYQNSKPNAIKGITQLAGRFSDVARRQVTSSGMLTDQDGSNADTYR